MCDFKMGDDCVPPISYQHLFLLTMTTVFPKPKQVVFVIYVNIDNKTLY